MERKLNPLFQQNSLASQVRIQEKFDPTPQTYTQNPSSIETSSAMEFINEAKLKLNRLAQKMTQFEDRFEGLTQEVRTGQNKLSGRFTERALAETRIEGLIERQNAVFNTFEKRMSQMGKTLEDAQLQLIRTQSALEDARKEIAKLKKL